MNDLWIKHCGWNGDNGIGIGWVAKPLFVLDLIWGGVGWGGKLFDFKLFIYLFYHYNYIFCGNVNLSFYLFKI